MPKTIIASVAFLAVMTSGILTAANKLEPLQTPESRQVHGLLKSEPRSMNGVNHRREFLEPEARPVNEPDCVWWQAGYVKTGREWKPYEKSVAEGNEASKLQQYREERVTAAKLPHSEWKLANWCRKNGLLDQERVHLMRALASGDSGIDRSAAFERLGYQRIGNSWVSPQEMREARQSVAEVERSHQRWDARLEAILKGLQGSNKQRVNAEASLKAIDDPVAVPALIASLCMQSESLAKIGIRTLAQIPQYQASRALAGQAVFSPWRSVRTQAIEVLKHRKAEEFVPDLMLVLSKPIQIRTDWTSSVNGSSTEGNLSHLDLNCDYAWIDESYDTVRVGVQRLYPNPALTENPGLPANYTIRHKESPSGDIFFNRASLNALLHLSDQAALLDYEADLRSEPREELNKRVGVLLSGYTGEPFSADPTKWWQWWSTYSSIAPDARKNVVIIDERKQAPSMQAFARPFHACLVAGTAVWTETGYVDIEKVQPGDRVLSKDIDSGELSYKPVLQITERDPTPIYALQLRNEIIETNAGHHFWVSGEGWLKTRQLLPSQPIHTVTGTERVHEIRESGRTAKVYNLIVADNHNYFVGTSMILSHDVLLPRPTNIKVPGLETDQ